ncbi:MAG: response regulator [Saprospiraceae bacterium]|nr:response regulator [Saprospiraceae bacterium]
MYRMLILLCLMSALSSPGTATQPVLINDELRVYPLDSTTEWLIDSSADWQLADVRNRAFHVSMDRMETVAPFEAIWLKTQLIIQDPGSEWLLLLKNPSLERSSNRSVYAAEFFYMDAYFVRKDDSTDHKRDGYYVPRGERAYYEQPLVNAIPFSVNKPDTLMVFVRVSSLHREINSISWEIRPRSFGIPKEKTGLAGLMMFCMGVTGILGLLSFFFFIADKDIANLYFSIFCYLLMFHYSMIHTELLFVKWFVPERPWLAEYGWIIMTNLLSVFFVLFARSFVNLRERSRRWDRVAIIVIASSLFCLLLSLLNHAFSWLLNLDWLYGLVFVGTLILVVRIAFLPGYLAKIIAFGSIWLTAFGLLGILTNMGYFGDFLPWPIGQLGLMVIYTSGLAYKLQLNERAKAEARKVLELDAIKSRFFANISHEFRTPLTLILGPLKKAQEQVPASEFAENTQAEVKLPARHIGVMRRNAERLQQLIEQLLDLAKLENGSMQLQLGQGDVIQFVRAMVSSFESLAELRQIHFQTDFPPTGQIYHFDKDKLEKIIVNLLSNAFKHTPSNGKVAVHTSLEKGRLRIQIEDNGPGIPPEEAERIFDRFYQVEGTETSGTGIGLALVKELVELHHGQITVESSKGKGSTFKISLPVAATYFSDQELAKSTYQHVLHPDMETPGVSEDYPGPARSRTEENKSLEETRLPLLLIVEDNPDLRHFIAESLKSTYFILTADHGRNGLEMAIEHTPDLIISDVMMPEMNGFELCQTLKNDERTSHIPVILLTAKAGQDHKVAGLETGADVYLTKPFDERELQVQARNLVFQRQRLQERYANPGEFKRIIHLGPSEISVISADQRFLEKVSAAIEDNMDNEFFSVEDLAAMVHFSRSQLHRKLKAISGKSPNELIREYRLTRAKELLEKGHGNVSEVAMSVGYSSLSYFSRSFKDAFGIMPSETQ